MVLVGYGGNGNGKRYQKRWSGWFAFLITSISVSDCYLQYNNFPSLSEKESMIASAVIPVCDSGWQGEIKQMSILIRLLRSLAT